LLATISIVVLLGFAALAVDVGYLYSTRRRMQTAADAAAVAGLRRFATARITPRQLMTLRRSTASPIRRTL
jgi:uncharacterized membrane protein